MRIPIVVLLISAALVVGNPTRAESRDETVVRVRIYDYAGLTPDTLAATQRLAASFYTSVGLTIDWAPTWRPHGRKDREADPGRLQDFTINVLSPKMVARSNWPKDAIGAAAVPPEGGGSIAYVLFDRLKNAADASGWPVKDLLGVVIAHELAHLLLPAGSHSSGGLMRKGWDVTDLRRMHPESLAFTPDQIALIRQRLDHMVSAQ